MRPSLALACAVFMLSGCTSLGGYPDRPEEISDKTSKLRERYFLPNTDVLATYAGKGSDRRAYRDEVVYGQLQAFDLMFSDFVEQLYKEGVITNLSLDIMGIGVGTAGATVTGAAASRVLSAVSAGIAGSQTSINKNLYYERTMPALLASMVAERSKILADIERGLSLSDDKYPLGRALMDIERYYHAGSIPGAITTITEKAGETKAKAETSLNVTRDKAFVAADAQERVKELVAIVKDLPPGEAYTILAAPPTQLDTDTSNMISTVTGTTIGTQQFEQKLKGPANDAAAKRLLTQVLLGIDRSTQNIGPWKAAIQAAK
ncbi:hypothetical protein ACFSM5_05525 [Lacibacterium aquatile]|uniref:Lipoprotein n=1 Tax=Lacibacterium aquatile TaxID=1168082 RepID=A0ABW5DNL5_9PROT